MTKNLNNLRASKANTAISAYAVENYGAGAEEDETILGDLLCDLRHYCDATVLDFHKLTDRSYGAYCEELKEDGGPATRVGAE